MNEECTIPYHVTFRKWLGFRDVHPHRLRDHKMGKLEHIHMSIMRFVETILIAVILTAVARE